MWKYTLYNKSVFVGVVKNSSTFESLSRKKNNRKFVEQQRIVSMRKNGFSFNFPEDSGKVQP